MLDVFFKDKSQYTTAINPLQGYLDQLTHFISVKKSLPQQQARELAVKVLKKHFQDKPIKYFEREENGDRAVKDGTLFRYIKDNVTAGNILVPTFTSYQNGKVKKSILSEFIFVNVKLRKQAKKLSQKAKAEGDMELYVAKDNEQSNKKIYNNSLSGVFGQEACVLHNPTAHNTLTSITRTMTSLSNASNEKLIAGNRYFPRPIDVLNSIVYISTYVNIEQTKAVIDKYNLYIPTVEDTVNVLKYSSDLYFSDPHYYNKHIIPYLSNLSPYQLAGICYIGDLYHLRKFNDHFIRDLFKQMTTKVEAPALEDISVIHTLGDAMLIFVHSIFYSSVKGMGKDYDKMNEAGIAGSLYATALHVKEVLLKYKDFFNTFFMTSIIPNNSFRLKNMRRRTVVLSDTDSTCFTVDEWITWYKGQYFVDDDSISMSAVITYIASQCIVHQLATFSRNMNVEDELLNTLSMKGEYMWTSFAPATVSKHYYAFTAMQEGNVFPKLELEIKGQILKNSAVPKPAMQLGRTIIEHVMNCVLENRKIKLHDVLKQIIDLEQEIANSVKRGEGTYLKKSKVKDKEAYAQEEMKSPYQRHRFWVDVFAPKYGDIPETPYDVVKIPTTITSKTLLNAWLMSIEDEALRQRLIDWLNKYGKKDLPTIYLNETYLIGNGIPSEIYSIIDLKRVTFDMTLHLRTILETLGVLLNDDLLVGQQFVL